MEYREKHRTAQLLQNNKYIESDRILLCKYQPNSSLMSRSVSMSNGNSLSFEIVFLLFDYVTPQEILTNRQTYVIRDIYYANTERNQSVADKKKDWPNLKSFQRLSGKISQMLLPKKRS